MTINELIVSVFGISLLAIIKAMVLVLMALYIVFAFVIVRQEQLMSQVVEVGANRVLQIVTVAHLLISIVIFILALLLL